MKRIEVPAGFRGVCEPTGHGLLISYSQFDELWNCASQHDYMVRIAAMFPDVFDTGREIDLEATDDLAFVIWQRDDAPLIQTRDGHQYNADYLAHWGERADVKVWL